jgi:hypothetical protein
MIIDAKAHIKELESFGKSFLNNLRVQASKAMLKAGQETAGNIRREIYAKHPGGKGNMARNVSVSANEGKAGEIAGVTVYSDLVYAAIQNYGGTIRPKRSKYLTIPLTQQARNRTAREWGKELRFIESKKGNLLLATVKKRKGKDPQIVPQYLLRKSVEIDGSGYFNEGVEKSLSVIQEALNKSVELTIEVAKQEAKKDASR